LGVLFVAGPARATWIEGHVYCDDGDEVKDAGDTPLDGVLLKAVGTTCVASPPNCTDVTGQDPPPASPAGYYKIDLPHLDGDYSVMIVSGLPAGASVIQPSDNSCEKHIDVDTGDPTNARKTCDFLVGPCVEHTTTSTTTSTTHTTHTTSSTSTSSTSSTTSTSSTSSTSNTTSTTSTSSTSSSSSSSSSTSTSSTSTTLGTTPLQFCEDTLDHLKCYRTLRNASFTPNGVNLVDQFEDSNMTVMRPYRLCNPVDKNDEGINDPTEHQMCYQVRDTGTKTPFTTRDVQVENQFGKQNLVVTRTDTLCTPAEKNGIVSDLNGDRMKCYRIRQKDGPRDFVPITVKLKDQFETKQTVVIKPELLCNPTELDGDPITSPTCHLVCYRIKDVEGQPEFVPVPVTVRDEFYDRSINPFRGSCRQISLLCVPSLKKELP
jgi:hypothetical protein